MYADPHAQAELDIITFYVWKCTCIWFMHKIMHNTWLTNENLGLKCSVKSVTVQTLAIIEYLIDNDTEFK